MKRLLVLVALLIFTIPVFSQVPCEQIVRYKISAQLLPEENAVTGKMQLDWTHTSEIAVDKVYFHAYLNAFRNSSSTFVREVNADPKPFGMFDSNWPDNGWGALDISAVSASCKDLFSDTDLLPSLEFVQPDDDNKADMTVFILSLPEPVQKGQEIHFDFEFTTKIPYLGIRAGYKQDFYMISQWFPKIGVLTDKGWNCHQYHQTSEYFADFGSYHVELTVPNGFVVGATGEMSEPKPSGENTVYTVTQDCIHDFAFTAYPKFLTKTAQFESEGLPPVEIKLLYLPEHEKFADRFLDAAKNSLSYYGTWYTPYPYKQLTIVDTPPCTKTASMEYPTLITVAVSCNEAKRNMSPEWTVMHEMGHQFWYGLVASNEFEEPWIDEGFTSFSDIRALNAAYGYISHYKYYLERKGFAIPYTFDITLDPMDRRMNRYRNAGMVEPVNQPSWEFATYASYKAHAYDKAAMMLATLENLLGTETFLNVMQTFASRYSYKHPTTQDFIDVVNEIAPEPMNWFFEKILYGAADIDLMVQDISSKPISPVNGLDEQGKLYSNTKAGSGYESRIVLKRNGDLAIPAEIAVSFENGEIVHETWDAKDAVTVLNYNVDSPVYKVEIDPEHKIVLDTDTSNNVRYRERNSFAAMKWGARWLFWLQHLLETAAIFS